MILMVEYWNAFQEMRCLFVTKFQVAGSGNILEAIRGGFSWTRNCCCVGVPTDSQREERAILYGSASVWAGRV
jgi:hypothetical protein